MHLSLHTRTTIQEGGGGGTLVVVCLLQLVIPFAVTKAEVMFKRNKVAPVDGNESLNLNESDDWK